MEIGVCIGFHSEKDIISKFKEVSEQGFHSCQLVCWQPESWTDENAVLIKEASIKYDVKISAFWCGWEGPKEWNFYEGQETLGLLPVTYRYTRMKNLMDGADFAKKLGVTDVVSHMGFIPEDPYHPNYPGLIIALKVVANHLKNNGQYLLFETGQETPVAILRAFEDIGTDNLGVNLDTANLILYGKANPVDALDMIGKYVRNVHAKDGVYPTDGRNLGEEVKIGTGKVDFVRFIKRLKELNYNGPITIEREIEGEQQLKDILEAKAYLEEICQTA